MEGLGNDLRLGGVIIFSSVSCLVGISGFFGVVFEIGGVRIVEGLEKDLRLGGVIIFSSVSCLSGIYGWFFGDFEIGGVTDETEEGLSIDLRFGVLRGVDELDGILKTARVLLTSGTSGTCQLNFFEDEGMFFSGCRKG